ncbi:hypothetical protein BN961_00219 [Afipia felis]|uniref:Uncharacterized protein n=1 Tax=Afipia felis TaxID=1035 RepID=A0A090N6H2_AFIFE|nr:hypothetical protein BN961_00219 [Afipia felis]
MVDLSARKLCIAWKASADKSEITVIRFVSVRRSQECQDWRASINTMETAINVIIKFKVEAMLGRFIKCPQALNWNGAANGMAYATVR